MQKLSTKLKRKHSTLVYFTTVILLMFFGAGAWLINDKIISWSQIPDNALESTFLKDDFVIIYKLLNPDYFKRGTYYAIQNPDKTKSHITIKKLVALPGDTLIIRSSNFRVHKENYKINRDSYFNQLTKIYLPMKNDSINISKLNLSEFDYVQNLIERENPNWKLSAKNIFLNNNIIMEYDDIFKLKLKRKTINSNNINKLSWQELNILKLQLEKKYRFSDIKIKRNLFRNDSLNINNYQCRNSYLFFVGDNGQKSLDSREFGYVPLNNVNGKIIYSYRPKIINFNSSEKKSKTKGK